MRPIDLAQRAVLLTLARANGALQDGPLEHYAIDAAPQIDPKIALNALNRSGLVVTSTHRSIEFGGHIETQIADTQLTVAGERVVDKLLGRDSEAVERLAGLKLLTAFNKGEMKSRPGETFATASLGVGIARAAAIFDASVAFGYLETTTFGLNSRTEITAKGHAVLEAVKPKAKPVLQPVEVV